MTREQKQTILRQFRHDLYQGNMLPRTLAQKHIAQNHTSEIWSSTMDRIIDAREKANSVFTSTKIMTDSIKNTMDSYMNDIIDWIYTRKSNQYFFINDTPYLENNLDENENPQKIGTGFLKQKGRINEYTTASITIILEKADNEYGFRITTAYPDLKGETAKPTNRNLTNIMKSTPTFHNANETRKKELLSMVEPPHTLAKKKYTTTVSKELTTVSPKISTSKPIANKTINTGTPSPPISTDRGERAYKKFENLIELENAKTTPNDEYEY